MLTQKGANAIKIISVAVGLLVSTLVFARLDYNHNYDTCFPDRDNLYQIWMSYNINGDMLGPFIYCPGKIAEGAVEALGDDISAATAIGRIGLPDLYNGKEKIDARIIGADSLFFNTLGIEIISGNPIKDLTVPNTIYISEALARQLYGEDDPIGKGLSLDQEKSLTISGIFRELPSNTTVSHFDAAISQTTYTLYEKRRLWSGGDNWPIYFRMKPESNLTDAEINRLLNRMYQSHSPDTDSSKTIITARPISKTYLERDSVKRMNLIMWILGSALLLMTTFNYVLVTIASLSRRAKAIGIHRCIGAGNMTIISLFMYETAIILICSTILMVAFLFLFEPIITDTLSLSVSQLLSTERMWIPIAILCFFFIIGGLLPGRILARIPVSQVFRRFTERNSIWKRSLLFIQIAGVSFVASLLITVTVQYHEIINRDMGFRVNNLAQITIPYNLDSDMLKTTLFNLPYVDAIAASGSNPLSGYSGEMVYNESGDAVIFNTRIEWIDKGYLDLMDITLLHGREPQNDNEIVISEEFARKLGKTDNPVGQYVNSGNNRQLIVGVVKDYLLQGFTNDLQPIALIPLGGFYSLGTLKLKEPFETNYRQLKTFFEESFPQYDFNTTNLSKRAVSLYSDVRMFRNSALIASVALIFISLMGLIGFARDEVQRRSKEIAIRKVNGAEATDIVKLLITDVARIALPAILTGVLCAAYIGHIWLSNFSVTASHIGLWYILAGLTVLILVTACVIAVTYRISNENPVNRLKSE